MNSYDKTILYHYTDFQALDGIIRCAQLRVNNVLNMNDAAEMRHFMTGLCSAVVKKLEAEKDLTRAEKVRKLFREELKKEFFYSAYAACFSLYRDDAAQWERYGRWGRGVCIAFRGEYLERIAKGAMSLQMVSYQDDMTEHALADIFYHLVKGETDLSENNPRIAKALMEAWLQSVVFKHPSFSSEKEVRLVFFPFEKESEKNSFNISPCYHVTTERIKKYYPLDLMSMCRKAGINRQDLTSEIIIGPKSTQSVFILQDYLRDNGLDRLADRVSLSNCPLRRLPV